MQNRPLRESTSEANFELRTPNFERRTSNAERRTPNAERRTPNAERRTPNAELGEVAAASMSDKHQDSGLKSSEFDVQRSAFARRNAPRAQTTFSLFTHWIA
jgi:hypothetical protein